MKNAFKRITALVLVLAMAFVFVPAGSADGAYAASVGQMTASIDQETGILTWNDYPEGEMYRIHVNDAVCYDYFYGGEGSDGVSLDDVINNLYAVGELPAEADNFDITLEAYNDYQELIANWKGSYEFDPYLESVSNVELNDGIVTWDFYPGADYYNVWIGTEYGEHVPGDENWFDLDVYMKYEENEPGVYDVTVKAFDEDGYIIAFDRVSGYEYSTPEYGVIDNVQIKNGVITWDPIEGIAGYYIKLDDKYEDAVLGTSYKLDENLDKLISEGILGNTGNHSIMISTDNPMKVYTWSGNYNHYYNNTQADTLFRYTPQGSHHRGFSCVRSL